MKYDAIIGLEIHVELNTKSKMFCSCLNKSSQKPNTNVCPICLGHPGTLPVPNKEAIALTILTGLALNCKLNQKTKFDRKNYFYPDLPKGYQISQLDLPLCFNGELDIGENKIDITRIHLEEDTGKSTHPKNSENSIIDFNRAGAPLMELVTEPVIKNSQEAKKFCQRYQQILRYLNISEANMEKGEMRCEVNISLQEKGKWKYENGKIKAIGDYKLNPKTEIKNLNSFKVVEKAIKFEMERQKKSLENKEELLQETRGWDENKNETVAQRIKETSADYRYFKEPDIPNIEISDKWIEEIKKKLIELPQQKLIRFKDEFNLEEDVIEVIINDKKMANWFEEVVSELKAWTKTNKKNWKKEKQNLLKISGNLLTTGLLKHLNNDKKNISEINITAENFAELATILNDKKINSNIAYSVLDIMYEKGGDPSDIIKENNWEQVEDEFEIENIVKQTIKEFPQQVKEYKSGKEVLLKFLIGKSMAKSRGKANPTKIQEILIKNLK
ncbi:Asp-tRNA(Asn)/Glu-tRNA(Gln) amidotransferase subunit GatB [bacterium]|nr:Asp-tRNA(Asn)/Glu-tRNA(Gln) amidotransferase subunit GatB [bacterium]